MTRSLQKNDEVPGRPRRPHRQFHGASATDVEKPICVAMCRGNGERKQKRQPAWVGVLLDTVLGGPGRNRTTDTRIFKSNAERELCAQNRAINLLPAWRHFS